MTNCFYFTYIENGNFNSHAHVERDTENDTWKLVADTISTHTLTWSVTGSGTADNVAFAISTHTLTWSVTINK